MKTNNENHFADIASGGGKLTLIKTTLRNQINLVSVTDQKANMLLSLNAIILSIVITVTGAKLAINFEYYMSANLVTLPIVILMLTCLISGILCIYAATPAHNKHAEGKDIGIMLLTTKASLKTEENFLKEMDNILKSNEMIYKNLSIDIFTLGMMLTRKYKLIRYAYYTFLIGMTSTVLLFMAKTFI